MSKDKQPEIRFPGFTDEWEEREFSEIVKTTGYKAYLSEAFEVGEYPVIQQGDKPILGYSDKKPFENFEDVVLFGDHTLSLYKPETPFLVATDGLKIITVPNFSGSFLLSLLEKYVPESQGYKRHFTILKKEQVAFPTDVKERVLIGEFFTQIDRTIILHERELDLLKETKKGFLQKMFPKNGAKVPEVRFPGFTEDWEERKVFEISKVTYGGGTPKTNTKEFWNGNIPWIQSSDLEINRLFNVSPKKKITNEAVKKSAAKIIPPNSIAIVTRVGVGKLALMPFEYATSQDFLSLSELQIDSYFGIFSLYSMLQKELKNIQGTSIKGMTKSDLLEKKVTIPKKYEEQQKIGNFFKQLDDTIALHQRKLDLLKETKKGFLQKMFV